MPLHLHSFLFKTRMHNFTISIYLNIKLERLSEEIGRKHWKKIGRKH